MGIGIGDLQLISRLAQSGHLKPRGAVCEIGAQQLNKSFFSDPGLLANLARALRVSSPLPIERPEGSPTREIEASDPHARAFWQWLGFEYLAIDIDNSPDSVPLDLNSDEVPKPYRDRYSLITNFGTTEHVCNQLNAFKIIHDLAAPGGIMLHVLPAQGYFNHGLVNYNPKFFWLLARSNDYGWISPIDMAREGTQVELPNNILTEMPAPSRDRFADYRSEDCGLIVLLQKRRNPAFVPPIDVATGAKAPNATLASRYPTVFAAS